jgi:hypothetical protein
MILRLSPFLKLKSYEAISLKGPLKAASFAFLVSEIFSLHWHNWNKSPYTIAIGGPSSGSTL